MLNVLRLSQDLLWMGSQFSGGVCGC